MGQDVEDGAQLLGPANSEPRLLSIASQLEAEQRWHEQRPVLSEHAAQGGMDRETALAG